MGYAGVIVGAIQVGVMGGQHWPLIAMSALVAALGHYNDHAV